MGFTGLQKCSMPSHMAQMQRRSPLEECLHDFLENGELEEEKNNHLLVISLFNYVSHWEEVQAKCARKGSTVRRWGGVG